MAARPAAVPACHCLMTFATGDRYVLSDIEIAQRATMEPITAIAGKLGIPLSSLESFGRYKAKIGFEYLESLKSRPDGKLILAGNPDQPLEIQGRLLISARRSVTGWPSGNPIDSQDTLAFCALTGVRPMTEVFPLERAAEAYERMMSGKARFRVVLTTGF